MKVFSLKFNKVSKFSINIKKTTDDQETFGVLFLIYWVNKLLTQFTFKKFLTQKIILFHQYNNTGHVQDLRLLFIVPIHVAIISKLLLIYPISNENDEILLIFWIKRIWIKYIMEIESMEKFEYSFESNSDLYINLVNVIFSKIFVFHFVFLWQVFWVFE